ncbi:MAG: ATP-dependent RecD-like DNA helicase [Phreatobacter sp.]
MRAGATPSPSSDNPVETLTGTIERVTFHSPATGFAVLKVRVRGRPQPVAIVGTAAQVAAGEMMTAEGSWVNDRTHGLQFRASRLVTAPPASRDGIEKYLASGAIKGIGIATAHRIVQAFGRRTFEVLDTEPHRLREIPGLTEARIRRITESWAEDRIVRDLGLFLQEHGLGLGQAARVYRALGPQAIGLIRQDPYRLARDVRGIGFLTADQVAMALGMARDAPERLRAGIGFALQQARDDGHTSLPREEAVALAARLLEADEHPVAQAAEAEVAARTLVADTIGGEPHLFLKDLHRAEKLIGERLRDLAKGAPPWGTIDLDREVPRVEARTGKALAPSQREALATVLSAKVAVITGGPGVGKTTLLDTVLKILARRDISVTLAAPTGRAAKRMTEQTGLEARTIHRLLEIDPEYGAFARGRDNLLSCDLLVVDETSMVDVPLMLALVEALPADAGLLMVGDVDQLPSVGPGQVLADIIASGLVPVARLTEVFRQAEASRIIASAHRINRGEMPDLPAAGEASDFYWVESASPEDGLAKIIEIVKERIPRRFGLDPMRDVQVLSPMNKGVLGARNLNIELQKVLNPPQGRSVERFGWTFAAGDRVMQTANDYDRDVFNGDLGSVLRVDPDEGELVALFDGRQVAYSFADLENLMPAYATTIHKSQGSEYPAVVIPVTTQHYAMLARNLIYTAVTRGRSLVVMVGEMRALRIAVAGGRAKPRVTKLREWLSV